MAMMAFLLIVDGDEVRARALQPGEAAQFHGAEDDHETARSVGAPASTRRPAGGDASPSALVPRAVLLLQGAMVEKRKSLRDVAAAWDCSHQLVHKVVRGERPFTVAHVMSLNLREPDLGLEVMRRLALELDVARRRVLVRALGEDGGEEMWAGIGHRV